VLERQRAINNGLPLPDGKFRVIYADPPWPYNNSGLAGSAERHYPTMSMVRLKGMKGDVKSRTSDDAVLFLWVTSPFLLEGLELCQAWAFDYKTNFIWIKDKSTYGKLGFYTYSQHELLLVATRGSCLPRSGSLVPSVIVAPKGEHSAKPELVHEIIEKMYPGPYLELFARKRRVNWESWGTLCKAEVIKPGNIGGSQCQSRDYRNQGGSRASAKFILESRKAR
jgi:N6-adenosine-specific RNA methylase IME4